MHFDEAEPIRMIESVKHGTFEGRGSLLWRYGIAILVTAVAVGGQWLIRTLSVPTPAVLFYPAVVAIAWYCGLGPALFASALLAIAVNDLRVQPVGTLSLDLASLVGATLFLLVAGTLSYVTARARQDRAAVVAEREWLRVTLAGIGDGVIATNPAGRVTLMNRIAEDLTGWPLSLALGQPIEKIFAIRNEFTETPIESPVTRVLREGTVVGLANHTILRARDGTIRPIADSGAPIRSDNGTLLGAVLVFRDASEQRRADRAAQRTARLYALATSLSAVLSREDVARTVLQELRTVLGADTGLVAAVDSTGNLLEIIAAEGYPADLMASFRHFAANTPMPGSVAFRAGRVLLYGSRAAVAAELPTTVAYMERNGHNAIAAAPLEIQGRRIGSITMSFSKEQTFTAEDEAFVGTFAAQCALALERARLYDQAQKERRRATVLAEASAAFSANLDLPPVLDNLTRRIVDLIGDACVVFLANVEADVLEIAASNHRDPADAEMWQTVMTDSPIRFGEGMAGRVYATGEPLFVPVTDQEFIHATLKPEHASYNARFPCCSIIAVPLQVGEQRLGTLSVWRHTPDQPLTEDDLRLVQDLADRAALAIQNSLSFAAAQAAVRAREEFLSVAAHELKTPLTSVLANVQLLQRFAERGEPVDPERQRTRLHVIEDQTRKLGRLISQLLDLTRLDAGRLVLESEDVDIVELVEGIVRETQVRTSQHQISVEAPPTLIVRADPLRLEQVLVNLLDNAIKYSPNGGPIWVRVATTDGAVRVSVEDRGLGVAPEHRPHLFDRFYRADPTAHISGLGLGLAVSKQIVELHGGSMDADYPPEGGSRFSLEIPLVDSTNDRL